MSTKPLKKGATYGDLRDVPEHFVAEMLDGDLYASPRPALPHANAAGGLFAEIRRSFHRQGPGGWVIVYEPELHLGNDVLVPDLAGWRRARLPHVPTDAYVTLAPDWICEVLSRSTEALDRGQKLAVYARERVAHAWLVDPLAQTLDVMSRAADRWTLRGRYAGEAKVSAAPFEAIEIELAALWT